MLYNWLNIPGSPYMLWFTCFFSAFTWSHFWSSMWFSAQCCIAFTFCINCGLCHCHGLGFGYWQVLTFELSCKRYSCYHNNLMVSCTSGIINYEIYAIQITSFNWFPGNVQQKKDGYRSSTASPALSNLLCVYLYYHTIRTCHVAIEFIGICLKGMESSESSSG